LSHVTHPTINWVTITSDGHLPPPAGVSLNGEMLYDGRELIVGEIISGFVVPSE